MKNQEVKGRLVKNESSHVPTETPINLEARFAEAKRTHLSDEEIASYHDCLASAAAKARAEAHLKHCGFCQYRLDELRQALAEAEAPKVGQPNGGADILQILPTGDPPENVWQHELPMAAAAVGFGGTELLREEVPKEHVEVQFARLNDDQIVARLYSKNLANEGRRFRVRIGENVCEGTLRKVRNSLLAEVFFGKIGPIGRRPIFGFKFL